MWKNYIWNPSTCSSKNGKYSGGIMGDSVVTHDGIMEATKTITTKLL